MLARIFGMLALAALAGAQARAPVVVELFTSEGCSSCPPADQLLMSLERGSMDPRIEVIALAEHVDYWNHLGWTDRFSSPLFSSRQQDYGRAFSMQEVYTPQMVVDGSVEFVGTEFGRAQMEIRKAASAVRASAVLAFLGADTVRIQVEHLPAGTNQANMLLAITESGLQTRVGRGENSGRVLVHPSTVRSLVSLGVLDRQKAGSYSAETRVMFKPDWRRENLKLVLLVQDRSSKRIVGAATLRP